jgi:integrase
MARSIHRLSSARVRTAKPGWHCDGAGLYLQVSKSESGHVRRSWVFRFNKRWMGLGSLDTVSLSEARQKATECRQQRLNGLDPIATRNASRVAAELAAAKETTFDQCRDAYIAAHRAGWRNPKHRQQWTNTLATYATPMFGKLSVQAIDVGLVIRVLEPIWATKPETASRVRGRIEAVLDWATARGFRQGENPARWRGHLDKLLPARAKVRKVKHHPALPYADISTFTTALRERDAVAARALEFAILTAARTGEVIGATWDEIDWKTGTWTVSADRMKSGREHRVALSTAAIAVLKRMAEVRNGDQIFPGDRRDRLSNMAMEMLLRRMAREDITVHGFRSTFRDWAAERTDFPREVAEMALAHAVGNKVEAAYRRGDLFEKRRRLMDAWAEYCSKASATGLMVPLRQTA